MRTEVDRHSHVPIYEQIAQHLRARVQEGEFALGDQLPTEDELTVAYAVSRSTLRKALALLTGEGMVARTSGKGTFVTLTPLRQPLHELSSFAESMTEQGYAISIQPLSSELAEPTPRLRGQLRLKDGEQVLLLERLHVVEGNPVGVDRLALPVWVQERVDVETLMTKSTYHVLEEAGIAFGRAEQRVAATSASARLAEVLLVRVSHPILMVERLAFSAEGQPVEHMLGHYRGDRVMLDMSLVRSLSPVVIAGPAHE